MRTLVIIFVSVCHLLLADAVTKELAAAHLKNEAAMSLLSVFNLAYVENRGCAWGLLQNRVWLLALIGLIAFALIIWQRRDLFATTAPQKSRRVCGRLAECLLYAGIHGNLIDRVFRGYVIDFLDFHWGVHHFPCFNLADTYITIAAGLMILLSFSARTKK